MASDNISQHDYYNNNVEPNATVNPNKKGPLWNANNNKQISCCIDNSINKNVWKRLNPDLNDFDKTIKDIEEDISKPEFGKLPVNGYKSQIVARYFCIDGDDGNYSAISMGNAGFMLRPHWYYESAGGDEYGMVALRLRDIGYMGTICRYVSGTTFNDVPSSVTMVNGETLELECTDDWSWVYKVKGLENGARLPIWPMVPNFAVTKIKFYHIPYDERAAPYLGTKHGSYKDLLYSIPFPYDRYDKCTVYEYNVPASSIVGWKQVSVEEYNKHWDMRKYVDPKANKYYVPITNGAQPYNFTDMGVGMQIWVGNGYHRTFADVYYEGEFVSVKLFNANNIKDYAVSLFYMYTGQTNYKGNRIGGRFLNRDYSSDVIMLNRMKGRTYYNIYGFCLYTIQSFRDTYNRYPDLIIGSSDYNWCANYLQSKIYNLHETHINLNMENTQISWGDMYVYINTSDGRYGIHTATRGQYIVDAKIAQPTVVNDGKNYKV